MLVYAGFYHQGVSVLMVPCSLFWRTCSLSWSLAFQKCWHQNHLGTHLLCVILTALKTRLLGCKMLFRAFKVKSQSGQGWKGPQWVTGPTSLARQHFVPEHRIVSRWPWNIYSEGHHTPSLGKNCFSQFQKSSFSFPGAVAVVNNQVFSALVGVKCIGAEMRP